MFYPREPGALREELARCFRHRLGPGALPAASPSSGARMLRAIIVPHAGLPFSGPVAAHAYATIAADGLPGAVVLVGPSHAGLGGLGALSAEPWRTPLGTVDVDRELLAALEGSVLRADEDAHAGEHSLEVQLPFLQGIAERASAQVRMLAVAMGLQDEDTAREVGAALGKACEGRDALLVASTDLMHAGPNYRIPVPRGVTAGQFVRAQDEHVLPSIAALDPDRLLDQARLHGVSMCGAGPVAAVLHAARALGCTSAELLAHATSDDVEPRHSAVGYASFALR
jgi:hypothetical protein